MKRLLLLPLLLFGCGDECVTEAEGPRPLYADPDETLDTFTAHPYPSDALRRGGGVSLRHFPNPTQSSTLEDYLRIFSADTDGFSSSAPLYLGFSAALDASSLPADPMSATADDAGLMLLDVDPASPDRGRRFPLHLRYRPDASLYLPEHTVTALIPFGVPLAPNRAYALVATRSLTSDGASLEADPHFANGIRSCEASTPDRIWAALAPLRSFLADDDLDVDDVVGGTVFTTQDNVGDVRRLAAAARAEPVPELTNVEQNGYSDGYLAFRAEVNLPGYQSGEIPYEGIEDGGELVKDEAGNFNVTHQERTRVSILIPRGAGPMPAAGWPVVLYAHGTGGSFESSNRAEVGDALGRLGIAVVGYDQTLHGPRDPTGADPRLTFFNLFNPLAARDNIRQGVVDATVMTSLLENVVLPASAAGAVGARFDPDKIGFMGHSQGGLTGSLFAATDERPKAYVFSGLGAILSITLQERKDIVDFAALLTSLLMFPEGEVLDDFHPVLGLIQAFIEPADPITYARSYLVDPPMGADRDLLMVEGFLDFASPARGQEAFATAAGFPVVSPVHRVPEAAALVGPTPVDAPATENVVTPVGSVTAGLIQYPEEDHFPVFRNADANRRYVEFLRTALLEGRGTIVE